MPQPGFVPGLPLSFHFQIATPLSFPYQARDTALSCRYTPCEQFCSLMDGGRNTTVYSVKNARFEENDTTINETMPQRRVSSSVHPSFYM